MTLLSVVGLFQNCTIISERDPMEPNYFASIEKCHKGVICSEDDQINCFDSHKFYQEESGYVCQGDEI